jgi:hypothetical protein
VTSRAIAYRYGRGYGLPLANEGEAACVRWLVDYGSERQDIVRFEAKKNLIIEAGNLDDDCEGRTFGERLALELRVVVGPQPDPAQLARSYDVELRRCLDLTARWRVGAWVVDALDEFCRRVLTAEQAAREREASSHHHRRHRRHRRDRQHHRRRSIGAFQRPDQVPADESPPTIPKPPPNSDHPPSPSVAVADTSPPPPARKVKRRRLHRQRDDVIDKMQKDGRPKVESMTAEEWADKYGTTVSTARRAYREWCNRLGGG